jgi:hypothetical protein
MFMKRKRRKGYCPWAQRSALLFNVFFFLLGVWKGWHALDGWESIAAKQTRLHWSLVTFLGLDVFSSTFTYFFDLHTLLDGRG